MPHAVTRDKVKLYFEEAGSGTPILFLHEFAGDYRSWEAQMRFFSRRHRCIAYSARGYLPSEIPGSGDAYSFRHFTSDAVDVLDHLGVRRAHIVGLSMGGYTALQVGLNHPDRALSLTLAATGSGSERGRQEEFRRSAHETAKQFESLGAAENFASKHGYEIDPNQELVALGFSTLPDVALRFAKRIQPTQGRYGARVGRDRHDRTIHSIASSWPRSRASAT